MCLDSRSGDSLEGSAPSGGRVHLDSDDRLVWPVLFLYPQYGQSDYIEAIPETDRYPREIPTCTGKQNTV